MIEITTNNPQGVEYPEAVLADGSIVRAIDLDKCQEDLKDKRFYFLGCEGEDEEEMLFVQRNRPRVTKFFRHKRGYIEDKDEPDRYLHNYAELRMKERFDKSFETGQFVVKYYIEEGCPISNDCTIKSEKCMDAKKIKLKEVNLREIYDTCTREKGEGKYIADLLLTNSKDHNIDPLFLEVFVTHKCTEEKLKSGYKIIEIKIEKKEDADNEIVENRGNLADDYLFMRPENMTHTPPILFYNFNRNFEFNQFISYGNFILKKVNGKLIADCRQLQCIEVENFKPVNEIFSLSIVKDELNNIDLYEYGMAFARTSGIPVRDCSLCKYYKLFDRLNRPCSLVDATFSIKDSSGRIIQYNNPQIYKLPYRCHNFDKSIYAQGCHEFVYDDSRIMNISEIIKNMHHKLWVEEGFQQTEYRDIHVSLPQEESSKKNSKDLKIDTSIKDNKQIDKPSEKNNEKLLVPLKACRDYCIHDCWECGFCGKITEKKDDLICVVCNNPDKGFLEDFYSEKETLNHIFKQKDYCPF